MLPLCFVAPKVCLFFAARCSSSHRPSGSKKSTKKGMKKGTPKRPSAGGWQPPDGCTPEEAKRLKVRIPDSLFWACPTVLARTLSLLFARKDYMLCYHYLDESLTKLLGPHVTPWAQSFASRLRWPWLKIILSFMSAESRLRTGWT